MIDLLRCPRAHEETWLVAAFHTMDGRFIVEGKLGCPICNASYDIVDGVARFGGKASEAFAPNVSAESVMRTAALLNLARPGLLAVLCGSEASAADDLSQLTQSRVIAINPTVSLEDTERVGTIVTDERIPLAAASVDAIAIGDCQFLLSDALRVLRPSGRLTVSSVMETPPGFRELARDDQCIVAEAIGPLVGLQRGV